MSNKLIIIGAGGHGKVIADIASLNGYKEILFLDDAATAHLDDYEVVGVVSDFNRYLNDYSFFVAIGNSAIRERIMQKLLSENANIPTLIHPKAIVGSRVELGRGTAVMAGAVINPGVVIGSGVIVNTCASIDHDCTIEDFCHVSVGARIAGTVHVNKHTFIGMGALLINNIDVCERCIIGAGAVVVDNINISGTYVGVPARKIK